MKKFATWFAAALAAASLNVNAREWTDSELVMLGASTSALVLDWGQTRTIATNYVYVPKSSWNTGYSGYKHYETNPILGRHPSIGKVNTYFTTMILGNYLVADSLDEYRTPWLLGVTVVELLQVVANKRVGISWRF